MSKKKPALVFRCECAGNRSIHVIARHQKGALSVLKAHEYRILKLDSGKPAISEVDDSHAADAFNVSA